MRNFRAPLNLNALKVCKSYQFLNQVAGVGGALQLYLNEAPAKVLSWEFYLVSQYTYLQNIDEGRFLLFFPRYYFLQCEELQDSEAQRFNNNANFNQF